MFTSSGEELKQDDEQSNFEHTELWNGSEPLPVSTLTKLIYLKPRPSSLLLHFSLSFYNTAMPPAVQRLVTTLTRPRPTPLSPSKLCCCNLLLLPCPLRGHLGKFKINKLAVTTEPLLPLKDANLTRALLKRSQLHSQLLSATEGGGGCERELVEWL